LSREKLRSGWSKLEEIVLSIRSQVGAALSMNYVAEGEVEVLMMMVGVVRWRWRTTSNGGPNEKRAHVIVCP